MGLTTGKESGPSRRGTVARMVPFGLVALAALCVAALGGEGEALLRYSRSRIENGELWRFLTAHLTHLGPGHLALNVGGLFLVAWLTGREYGPRTWAAILLVTGLAVTVGIHVLSPAVEWYVGLSGVLHGLLAAGLIPGLIRRETESIVLAGLLLAKIVWEALAGPLPGSESSAGGPVLIESHRYGALGGLAAGLAIAVWAARGRAV